MLIDLARNDVGRVAEYGSVTLSDVMVVERYSHVMHITSNVCGQLREGLSAIEALRAGLQRALSPARRRCERWKSSMRWSLRNAGRMAGRGIHRFHRQHGHLHRVENSRDEGRHDLHPGRRRHRGGQRSGNGVQRNPKQSPRDAQGDSYCGNAIDVVDFARNPPALLGWGSLATSAASFIRVRYCSCSGAPALEHTAGGTRLDR